MSAVLEADNAHLKAVNEKLKGLLQVVTDHASRMRDEVVILGKELSQLKASNA